ncbi:iron ABC transporter permease [Campylobacter sp. RM16190]|uniref:ABC transporter permease n=1 Tax=Campylobacter sp. RM16190 TaxID=1705727 RepID=UPI0014741095
MNIKSWAITVALIILVPIISIFFEIAFGDYSNLEHFFKYLFLRYIQGTFLVAFGVLALSATIAVISAWIVANYRFPFVNFFEYALMLPLAIPAYIFSFCYVGIMEFQGYFHKIFGFRLDFMNIYGAIFVLSLSLYPYIYMFAKTSFKTQSKVLFDVCKIYKLSQFKIFRVAVMLSRPAIIGGAMLVLMETLSDYGTVAYYGVATFSAGIFKLWFDLGDSYSASILAAMLMVLVFIIMIFEHINKNSKGYSFNTHNIAKTTAKSELNTIGKTLAFLWCFVIFCLAFLFPVIWLVYWSIMTIQDFKLEFITMAGNSLLMAIISAILITFISFFLVFSTRIIKNNKLNTFLLKTTSLGYALPGASIGLCVMIVFGYIDRNFGTQFLSASFVVLIFGYIVRFLATSVYAVESGYAKIPKNIDDASLLLNRSKFTLFFKVHFPLLRHFFFLSLIVVFIDIVKELPLSLILRPLGFETLSIRAFFYATDERLYAAALPSLLIVLLSLVAVIWLEIISRKKA